MAEYPFPHTDITNNSWVDQYLPHAFAPYCKLMRLDRPVGAWLTILPGFWGLALSSSDIKQTLPYILYFILGGFLVRAVGCIINDIFDRKLDKQVERTAIRPLPSGALSLRQALCLLFFCLNLAFFVLLQMPSAVIKIGLFALIPISIYPLMKRITYWPQLFLGGVFNLSFIMGWMVFQNTLPFEVILIYLSCVFLTIGYDTIYAFQDIVDDLKTGVKSTAIKFKFSPKKFVGGCYLAFIVLFTLGLSYFTTTGNLAILLLPIAHLIHQIQSWIVSSPQSGLKVFKSNVQLQWLVLFSILICLNV